MAFFNKKKKELNDNENQEAVNNEDLLNNEVENTEKVSHSDGEQLHETVEVEIIEAVGQGSEDVKNITIKVDDDEENELKFVVSAGMIKNIESTFTNFDISNRLNWVDSNKFTEEELERVSEILEENDFFDALTILAEENEEHGEDLAEIVAQTYLERSYKALVYAKDLQVKNVKTDWIIESDSETVESYTISISPEEISEIVEDIETKTKELVESLENGFDTAVYVNDNTDYEVLENDVDRYIVGAAINMFEDNTNNGVFLDILTQYSDGFSVPEVIEAVIRLEEEGVVSFYDPYYTIEADEEVEDEVEDETEDEISLDFESDLEPFDEEDEEEEDEEEEVEDNSDFEHIIDEPFPHDESGTPHLGGALNQYVGIIINGGKVNKSTADKIAYLNQYNTLYEQGVIGIERALTPTVRELNRSVEIYEQFSELAKDQESAISSNLHTAVYSLEAERSTINESRMTLLEDIRYIVEDIKDSIGSELTELVKDSIDLKIEGILQVKNSVYGSSSKYVPDSEFDFNETTIPTYYNILKDLGIAEVL